MAKWSLVKFDGNYTCTPENAIGPLPQAEDPTDPTATYYAAVANSQWGQIFGKASLNRTSEPTCWYPYGELEYTTQDFWWIVKAPGANWSLITFNGNDACAPENAIGPLPQAGDPTDPSATYYAAVANSQWGKIFGKASLNRSSESTYCWYPYGGKEYYTTYDFSWIVIGNPSS